MKKQINVLIMVFMFALLFSQETSAVTELAGDESSYTYSYWGDVIDSPVAYTQTDSLSLRKITGGATCSPSDLAVGTDGTLYITDKKNNCVYIVSQEMALIKKLDNYQKNGESCPLSAPEGIYCCDQKIYVANTGGQNILVYGINGDFIYSIDSPSNEELGTTVKYEPYRVAADHGGRVYVISRNQTQGIIQFNKQGKFIGYLGASRVIPNATELFYRAIATKEMKKQMLQFIPTEYNNLTVDEKGFVYATISAVENGNVFSSIQSRSAASITVRKLNPLGNNILINTWYFPQVGEISFTLWKNDNSGASRFIDVTMGPSGTYSILENKRNKIFTYDRNGSLLYIFGGVGEGKGKLSNPVSIGCYNNRIFILDSGTEEVKCFEPTVYAQKIQEATQLYEQGNYDASTKVWNDVKREYIGSDLADLGLGKSALDAGDNRAAMRYFRYANSKIYYSKALKAYIAEVAEKNLIWIFLISAVLITALVFAFRYGKKAMVHSKRAAIRGVAYAGHVMLHPFDGFWELKFEKKGNAASATILLLAAFIINSLKIYFTPYLFNSTNLEDTNVLVKSFSTIIVIAFLWIVANWCFTTLFDGKGTMKDIYCFTCYSLFPYVLFTPVIIIISYIFTQDAVSLYNAMNTFLTVWIAFLIFTGTLTTHQYSAARTMGVILMTFAGMGIIAFLALLCSNLVVQIYDFIASVAKELLLRF